MRDPSTESGEDVDMSDTNTSGTSSLDMPSEDAIDSGMEGGDEACEARRGRRVRRQDPITTIMKTRRTQGDSDDAPARAQLRSQRAVGGSFPDMMDLEDSLLDIDI